MPGTASIKNDHIALTGTSMRSAAKRITAFVFALALALSLVPASAYADVRTSDIICGNTVESLGLSTADCASINAQYAYVVSSDGMVYMERDADTQTQIASVTKVMTALVALTYGDADNTTITVSDNAASVGESSAGLQSGDSMNLRTALKALLLSSGNDAAVAIAESMGDAIKATLQEQGDTSVPDNAYDAFVYAMNKKASELGMTNSVFANPHGLDDDVAEDGMYSTARDVSKMCIAAMDYELFRSIVSTDAETIQVTREGAAADIALESTDELLGEYEGACGIKTGFTDKAGYCFAGCVERDGEYLYAIVLNSDSATQRFSDAEALDEWVYNNTVDYALAQSSETTSYTVDETTTTVPVVAYVAHNGWTDRTFKATLADPDATVEVFALNGNVSQDYVFDDVSGNIVAGQKVGTAYYYQHNKVVATVDIVAAEDCAAPNFIEGIAIWWQRLFSGVSGDQTVAKSTIVNTTPLIFGGNAEN